MKIVFKGLAFASLLLCLTQVQAANTIPSTDGGFLMSLTETGENLLVLRMANLQQVGTSVSLHDLDGNVYFREYIKDHNGYSMKVDISAVPEGRYIMRVQQKGVNKTQVIYKSEDQLLISHVNTSK